MLQFAGCRDPSSPNHLGGQTVLDEEEGSGYRQGQEHHGCDAIVEGDTVVAGCVVGDVTTAVKKTLLVVVLSISVHRLGQQDVAMRNEFKMELIEEDSLAPACQGLVIFVKGNRSRDFRFGDF